MITQTEWREVLGFPEYHVSKDGRIFSLKTNRVLAPALTKGYRMVGLRSGARRFNRSVHSLVAEAFIGPRPASLHCAHLDGNAENNASSNLRWVTQKENEAHKRQHGTARVGEKSHHAKLTDEQVTLLRKGVGQPLTRSEWARLMGISERSLFQILRGETYAPRAEKSSRPFGDHHGESK